MDRLTVVPPFLARLCPECRIVTTDQCCPLCRTLTKPHRRRQDAHGYCMDCGEGPMPQADMHLVTWDEDPYKQDDVGMMLNCICGTCHQLKFAAEQDEPEEAGAE